MFSIKNDIIAVIVFIVSTITYFYMNHVTTTLRGEGLPWWVALTGLLSILFWLLSLLYMAFSLILGKE